MAFPLSQAALGRLASSWALSVAPRHNHFKLFGKSQAGKTRGVAARRLSLRLPAALTVAPILPLNHINTPKSQPLLDALSGLAHSCEGPHRAIMHHNRLVAVQFPCALPTTTRDRIRGWHCGWHGTAFSKVQSIVMYGLQPPGTRLPSGVVVQVAPDHVPVGKHHNGVNNWAHAVFIAPSIAYASESLFVDTLEDGGDQWCCVINARANPAVSTGHSESKITTYVPLRDEPDVRKYRVSPMSVTSTPNDTDNLSGVVVTAVLVVSKTFIRQLGESHTFNEVQALLDRAV